jgi:hypothetical protein
MTWGAPSIGDFVWCLFPQLPNCNPGPKPRPALIIGVEERDDGIFVRVVYGTSKNVTKLKIGEVAITKANHSSAYALAGLAYDTKFDFKVIIDVPWTDEYFKVPGKKFHGHTPKLGTLHVSVFHAFQIAHRSAEKR